MATSLHGVLRHWQGRQLDFTVVVNMNPEDAAINMKIYFAGSIRGGRDDAEIYYQIIEFLREYGEILTEHVGKKDLIFLNKLISFFASISE